jgi:hypothetical protein
MAQFYGEVQGNRGTASRMGGKASGFWAHIRGWGVGVRVDCRYDKESDSDVIRVYRTSGSNGGDSDKLIATIYEKDGVMFEKGVQGNYGIVLHQE